MADKESGENRNQRGQFLPGNCANPGGRPKGSRNATTMTIKDGLVEAYHQLGGIQWLVRLGQEEPRTFASLLLRLLPPTPIYSAQASINLSFVRIVAAAVVATDTARRSKR